MPAVEADYNERTLLVTLFFQQTSNPHLNKTVIKYSKRKRFIAV